MYVILVGLMKYDQNFDDIRVGGENTNINVWKKILVKIEVIKPVLVKIYHL